VRLHAVANARAVDVAADEPRVLQDLEVLGDCGLREGQLVDDVAADASVPAHEETEDLHASRVTHGLAEQRELFVGRGPLHGAEVQFLLRS